MIPQSFIEGKVFDARVVGSITSGILLIQDFGKVHECIEWATGYPVWTHELPAAMERLTPKLLALFPSLPAEDSFDHAEWRAKADELAAKFPDGISLEKGTDVRTRHPVATLADMVDPSKIIVVEVAS